MTLYIYLSVNECIKKSSLLLQITYFIASVTPGVIRIARSCTVLTLLRELATTRAPSAYESLVANVTHAVPEIEGDTRFNSNENENDLSYLILVSPSHEDIGEETMKVI